MVCDCGVTWTDWATLATSAGTVVLAVVAWYQARQAKSQIEQTKSQIEQTDSQIELGKGQLELGRGQLEAAQEASREAANVHRESIRARVDQFAPRVSVHYKVAKGPYYSSIKLDHYQRIHNPDPIWERSAAGMGFILPKEGEGFLWLEGRALVVNDGPTPARVRLPSEATFVADRSEISGEDVPIPPFRRVGVVDEAVLAPGMHAMFQWSAGKSVGTWAEAAKVPGEPHAGGSVWLWITVFDDRQDGVIDTLVAHLKPEILTADRDSTDIWRVTDSKEHEIALQPTLRGYRNEGASVANLSQMYDYHGVDENGQSK